ncbi:MAG TPA: S8 family serine peptidase [Sphingomicrobium sp.]|nr:S8 family serine peptidase [Sphingomicrobium sp.]
MKMLRLLLLGLVLGLARLSPAAAEPRPAADHEILVMVKHPPDHYRANGAYGGGYGDELARSERERLARRIARSYRLTFVDQWPMPMIGMDCFVMAVTDGRTTAAAASQVGRDSNVAWAQPVSVYQAQSAARPPNDPLFEAEPAAAQWDLADLHRIATGRGIRVAVIDSGIEATHPDLAGQVIVNRNFIDGQSETAERHGTGVAGIIAAKADNGIGIAGVAPDARLLGLRACWQKSPGAGGTICDSFSLAKALYFAIEQKADVINLSLSGPGDLLLGELVKTALAHGSVVVAAYDPRKADGGFPASVPGVIAVSDAPVASARGHVYIAPGHDVPTTQPGGRWFLVNGSSYAAAHVSGLVALVRQRRRASGLTLVADRPGGGIDACATLVRAASGCECSCGPISAADARALH